VVCFLIRSPMSTDHPTLTDPVIVMTADRTSFVCWVEPRDGIARWVFIGADRMRYNGPVYRGEQTLDVIRALVARWWDTINLPSRAHRTTQPPAP
jgi:hypothetical protein